MVASLAAFLTNPTERDSVFGVARCLISAKLEEGWERPLADWRGELGLPEAPLV